MLSSLLKTIFCFGLIFIWFKVLILANSDPTLSIEIDEDDATKSIKTQAFNPILIPIDINTIVEKEAIVQVKAIKLKLLNNNKIESAIEFLVKIDKKETTSNAIIISELELEDGLFVLNDSKYISFKVNEFKLRKKDEYIVNVINSIVGKNDNQIFSDKTTTEKDLYKLKIQISEILKQKISKLMDNKYIYRIRNSEYDIDDLNIRNFILSGDDFEITLGVDKILPNFILWIIIAILSIIILVLILSLSGGSRGGSRGSFDFDLDFD
jgi:hypothetical protein